MFYSSFTFLIKNLELSSCSDFDNESRPCLLRLILASLQEFPRSHAVSWRFLYARQPTIFVYSLSSWEAIGRS